jgi:hypothetical protein
MVCDPEEIFESGDPQESPERIADIKRVVHKINVRLMEGSPFIMSSQIENTIENLPLIITRFLNP